MKKGVNKLLTFGAVLAISSASALTSFATTSYSEWYYNKFNEYPTGNISEWEQDPVYWQYLNENDSQAYKDLNNRTEDNDADPVYPVDPHWDDTTARWSVNGKASKYQVRLYKDNKKITTYSGTGKSHSFSSEITASDDYWFEVRACSKYDGSWSDWESSESKWFNRSSSSSSSHNQNTVLGSSGGPGNTNNSSWSSRWVGNGESWQVKSADGSSYISNSWWLDGSTNEWYLLGCTGEAGKESYMSAGLFRDAKGDWYLLNPLHDGTYGRMLSGDNNGNYTLNYNGQSIPVTFNKNHDGSYGKITSDVNAILNVLGKHFELNYVPATAQ